MNFYLKLLLLIACVSYTTGASAQLTIYDGFGQSGTSVTLGIDTIYKGASIPSNLNDHISSIHLESGHMVVMADNIDGTGFSKAMIALTQDLIIDLPIELDNKTSFIRVLPYNISTLKKGLCTQNDSIVSLVNSSWFYDWGRLDSTKFGKQFVPMQWGWADNQDVDETVELSGFTELLGFNEPDDCNSQSGQWGDLCIVDTAVASYRKLLATGLRLGSPAVRENQPLNWLDDFMVKAKQECIRVDFIAVHWYDWGGWFNSSNPAYMNPDANPVGIFNRFKNKLTSFHTHFQLPIWVTEFNANRNRNLWVQEDFLELAMAWMDTTDWIERYSYFEPSTPMNFSFIDTNYSLTGNGQVYNDHVSTLAISSPVWDGNNSLTSPYMAGTSSCVSNIEYPTTSTIDTLVCNTFTGPSGNYEWGNTGTYMDTLINIGGYDSLITINLTVPVIDTGVTQSVFDLSANMLGAQYQWMDCYNNTILNGETNQSFVPPVNGMYAVILSSNGCSDTSSCVFFQVVGLDEIQFNKVKIYPNPVIGDLKISFPSTQEHVVIKVFSPTGKLLETLEFFDTDSIDINTIKSRGVYFIELSDENDHVLRKKIIFN